MLAFVGSLAVRYKPFGLGSAAVQCQRSFWFCGSTVLAFDSYSNRFRVAFESHSGRCRIAFSSQAYRRGACLVHGSMVPATGLVSVGRSAQGLINKVVFYRHISAELISSGGSTMPALGSYLNHIWLAFGSQVY